MIDALSAVAEDAGRPHAQVALQWLLQRPGVTAPIIGPRTFEHLEDSLGALQGSLTDDQMRALDAASDRPAVLIKGRPGD